MKRYDADEGIATLEAALSETMRADELKTLAALVKAKLPTRKADLAAVVMGHLEGERLRTAWQILDELQQAAVAAVVHSSSTRFLADRFRAKYGRAPNWGSSDKYGRNRKPSASCSTGRSVTMAAYAWKSATSSACSWSTQPPSA